MEALGWDSCDIVFVTGDAYVDPPSFGMAVIGRMLEAKADLLVYGNAERQIVDIAHRLAAGEAITDITDVRGTAFVRRGGLPEEWAEIDSTDIDLPGRIARPADPYAMSSPSATACKTN